MADVREVAAPRADAARRRDRLGQRKVGRVRLSRSASSTSTSRSCEQRPRLVGDVAAVGEIREPAEAIARGSAGRRASAGPAAPPGGPRRTARRCGTARAAGTRRLSASSGRTRSRTSRRMSASVRASPKQAIGGAAAQLIAPDFVEAEDVVGVAVREEDRVHAADVVRQRLRAQVGPGVDQQLPAIVGRRSARTGAAAVARIGGPADGAVAADHRHAVRRAGAEKRDLHNG